MEKETCYSISNSRRTSLLALICSASDLPQGRKIKQYFTGCYVKFNAKVSDFRLSRPVEPGLSHVSTCAQGTLGCLDPKYYRNYQLADKGDVYGDGVVLLELLTLKKTIDFGRGMDDVNLAVYVARRVEEHRLMHVVDG